MRITCGTRLLGVVTLAALGFAQVSLADSLLAKEEEIGDDGYNKTYNDPSVKFKDRMKEAREVPVMTVSNDKGGFFLGVNGALGAVYDSDPKSSSGTGFGVGVEPGYVIQSDNWSRFEFGLQLAYNSFTWKNDSFTYTLSPLVFMPRVGWGNSLGNNLFGVMKVGFGIAMNGQAEGKSGDIKVKTSSTSGFLLAADYDLVYGSGKVQFTGGLGVVHHKYSWAEATTTTGTTSTKNSDVAPTNLNFVNLHGGVRVQF